MERTEEESFAVLERLLGFYGSCFDIERQFSVGAAVYDAYGYCSVASAKYVLVKEAQLWRVCTFEHLFFRCVEAFTGGELQEYQRQLGEHLEPEFVRHGETYPAPDHMCTALTNIYICRRAVPEKTARQVQKYKFRQYYRFALRGYCEARLAVLDLENRKIYGNPAARQLVKHYKRLFRQEG